MREDVWAYVGAVIVCILGGVLKIFYWGAVAAVVIYVAKCLFGLM